MKNILVFEKRELMLKEDGDNTAYVDANSSTSNGQAAIGSAAQDSINDNPTADSTLVNMNDFDGDASDNTPTMNLNANKSGSSVQQAINNAMKNPATKKLADTNNLRFKVNFENRQRKEKQLMENSIKFTKSELDSFLRNL